MKKVYSLNERQDMKKRFYKRVSIPYECRVDEGKSVKGYIYKIVNKTNGKVYIGKTTNLSIRSANYVRVYCSGKPTRDIEIAMINEGIDNFYMTAIAEYDTEDNGCKLEVEMMKKYDSVENGYNQSYISIPNYSSGNPNGKIHTSSMKMSKSKFIVAINNDTNEIVFSAGMKLFGDYIGKSKDLVKNRAKNQTKISKYFIIYMDDKDRKEQIDSICKRYSNYKHIKKELLDRLSEFLDCAKIVEDVVNKDVFINPGYKIKCLLQSDNKDEKFKELSLNEFIQYCGH